jgi:predicted amidophosphoribosyltransferase
MFLTLIRSCCLCGCSLPPIYFVCRWCWERLRKQSRSHTTHIERFQIHHLWTWRERTAEVGLFLKKRKRLQDPYGDELLARLLLLEFGSILHLQASEVIVFPTKQIEVKDHGWRLAQALGKQVGLPLCPVVLEEVSNYKHLTRSERHQRRRAGGNHFSLRTLKNKRVLIIDDVVTTGATIHTVWESIGRPSQVTVLSLAYKTFRPDDKI